MQGQADIEGREIMNRLKRIRLLKGNLLTNKMGTFLFAVLTAFALTTSMNVDEAVEAGITIGLYKQVYKLIEIIGLGLKEKGFLLSVLTILFLFLYWYVWIKKGTVAIRYSKGLSFFLAVMYVAGMGFAYGDSLSVIFSSSIRLLRAFIAVCGFYAVYLTAVNVFYVFLKSDWDIRIPENKLIEWYRKKPFLFAWIVIMGIWLVHLILRYPGTMSYDNARELSFYFGYDTFTTAQPIFHTVLFSFFVQIGIWLGSENLGLFFFVIFQSLIMSGVLAYSLTLMRRFGSPRWLRLLTIGIYTFAPYYAGYASFPIKDYLYTAFFVLLLLYSMEWFLDGCFAKTGGRFLCWVLAGSLLILLRNNGIYIYVPLAITIVVAECKHVRKAGTENKGKHMGVILAGMLLPLLVSCTINAGITAGFHVQKDTPKEMLSLPFQQTARYVRDYGDEVTQEEREAIDAVLDYQKIPEVYMELTADPVKTTYHAHSTEELLAYFKVWFAQFLKHPLCYVEATWNQNYYVFAPNIDNIVYNKDCTVAYEIMNEMGMQELIEFKVPEMMHGICTIMVSYYSLLTRLPIIGLLNNVAFYIILLFVITCFFLKGRQKKALWMLLPLWLTFLIIIASPQIQNQPRYAFPIIYSMPIVVAFFIRTEKVQ